MKKVLVTGGAGFIGSNLCKFLRTNTDYDIYSLDNYFTGSERNHISGVTYLKGACVEINSLVNFNPHITYHLGEYSRVEQSFEDMDLVWEFNKRSIFEVLKFCLERKSKLIYAGSSTKYGDGGLGRFQSPYAWSKASNTELVKNFGNWFGLEFAITYFYNVYGPSEISQGKYATLIGLFTEKMRNGDPLTVVAPGSQTRNFTHIDDITKALLLIGEKGAGDEYGIGSEQSYSIIEVAKMFGGIIQLLPERRGNRHESQVVTEKTKLLGWSSEIALEQYINEIKQKDWLRD